MPGIRIRHRTLTSCVALIPVMSKPLRGTGLGGSFDPTLDACPSCHLVHVVKTVHLWLDDSGSCIVSRGVLEELRLAGMPELDVAEEITNPPPLTLGVRREEQDHQARAIVVSR